MVAKRSGSIVLLLIFAAVFVATGQWAWSNYASAVQSSTQAVADGAALAGASQMWRFPPSADSMRMTAIMFVNQATVMGRVPVLEPEHVQVDVDEGRIDVRLRMSLLPLDAAWFESAGWFNVWASAAAEARSGEAGPIKRLKLVD